MNVKRMNRVLWNMWKVTTPRMQVAVSKQQAQKVTALQTRWNNPVTRTCAAVPKELRFQR